MLNTTFPPWPCFTPTEAEAVSRVLRSNRVNYWTGTECRAFEREFADWTGVPYAVALSNGTIALEVALRAAGIKAGDEVVVTPRSYFASASSVVSVGAIPVFADVDRNSQNITADTIARVLTSRTRAIIPVHLSGMPCDMDPIMSLARSNGIVVIEDCAQAHGASYKGRNVGSIADIGVWSFCQDKIITTGGEGGMVTTNDRTLWQEMWSYKDHGKSWHAVYEREHAPGYRWLHEGFGTNGRMIEMEAVIGRIQLLRMPEWSAARRKNAERIWSTAEMVPGLRVPRLPCWATHACYKAYVFVEPTTLKAAWDRDRILAEITERQVPCYTGVCPEIYRETAFADTGWRPQEPLPAARELGATSLMFLVHPTLESRHIDRSCDVLTQVMRAAVK